MQAGKWQKRQGGGQGTGRGGGVWQTAGSRIRRARRKVRTGQEVALLFLSLCICHSGVSENATKLPNRVPGNADVETRGRKATGKLREPEPLGQARAEAGKGPGTWTVSPASRCPTSDADPRAGTRVRNVPASVRPGPPRPTLGGGGDLKGEAPGLARSRLRLEPPGPQTPKRPPRGTAGARAASPHSPWGSIPRPWGQTHTHGRRPLCRLERAAPIPHGWPADAQSSRRRRRRHLPSSHRHDRASRGRDAPPRPRAPRLTPHALCGPPPGVQPIGSRPREAEPITAGAGPKQVWGWARLALFPQLGVWGWSRSQSPRGSGWPQFGNRTHQEKKNPKLHMGTTLPSWSNWPFYRHFSS